METNNAKSTPFTTYFVIEMEIDSYTLKNKVSNSEEVDAAVGFQLRFVRELLETISLLSSFAVTSLLSDEEINEYAFDHIKMLESFKFLTEFAAQVLQSASIQSKTGVLK